MTAERILPVLAHLEAATTQNPTIAFRCAEQLQVRMRRTDYNERETAALAAAFLGVYLGVNTHADGEIRRDANLRVVQSATLLAQAASKGWNPE